MWLALSLGALVAVYTAFVVALVIAGRRSDARAATRLIPDLIILFGRLLGDPRLPRRHKALVAALIPYLAMPFDIVPDFIPVAGQLDDAIMVAFVLRVALRGRPELITEHWPGPSESLWMVQRLAGVAGTTAS
jgi:uncharacterized membrane protein YkvA (DUF1232 family)